MRPSPCVSQMSCTHTPCRGVQARPESQATSRMMWHLGMMEVSGNGIGKKERKKALQVKCMVKQRAGGGRKQRRCPDNHNHPPGKLKHWGQLRTVVGATVTRLSCLKVRRVAPCAPSPPHCSPLCAGCSQRQPRACGEDFDQASHLTAHWHQAQPQPQLQSPPSGCGSHPPCILWGSCGTGRGHQRVGSGE